MSTWDIAVGEQLLRRELHDRWGGGRQGGIEPAVKANSVFLFATPERAGQYGYRFDEWHEDGTYHYTGDGTSGDQRLTVGGNKSVLDAEGKSRPLRLFEKAGKIVTYVGVFELDSANPWYRADSPGDDGELRSVVVFRLHPIGEVLRGDTPGMSEPAQPVQVPLEASNVETYAASRPDEPPLAVRKEAMLVQRYADWLAQHGSTAVRHRVPLPEGGDLYTDLFVMPANEVIEAKASIARGYVRSALGQILDYRRFLDHDTSAVLLPLQPSSDMIELLNSYGVAVIWEVRGGFDRTDPAI